MKPTPIILGIIAGIAGILLKLIVLKINPNGLFTFQYVLANVAVIGVFMYFSIKNNNQDSSYRALLSKGFITFLIASIIIHIFDIALFKSLEPSLVALEKNAMLEFYSHGKNANEVNEMKQTFQNQDFHDVKSTVFDLFRGLLGAFVLSGIMAFVFKKINKI